MTTFRTVTGRFTKPDNTPLKSGVVRFELVDGSYTPDDNFGPRTVLGRCDDDGEFEIELWANGEGDLATEYKCTLPGSETFNFILPAAGGAPITLSEIRALNQVSATPGDTLLTYLAARFGVSVIDEGADPTGVADSGPAFAAAAAKVQAAGRGIVWVPPGNYLIYKVGTVYANLMTFSDLSFLGIVFAEGAKLMIDPNRTGPNAFTVSYGNILHITDCDNVHFTKPWVTGPNTVDQTGVVKGVLFAQMFEGCDGITLDFGRFEGVLSAIQFSNQVAPYPDANRCKNINIGTMLVKNSWYGVAATHSGNHVRIDQLICDSVFRGFIGYGIDDWKIGLFQETNHKGGAALQSIDGDGCSNIEINFATRDSTAAEAHPHVQMSWDVVPGYFRNIRLNFDADLPTAGLGQSNGGPLFTILKFNGANGFDTVDRGHVLDGLFISCRSEGNATVPDNPLIGTHNECGWGESGTPDVWRNVVMRDFSVKSGRYCRFNIGAMDDQLITLDNVSSDSDIEFVESRVSQKVGKARIGVQPNCKFPNLYKFNAGAYPIAHRNLVGSVAIPAGSMYGNPTFSNEFAGGDQDLALPAALPGMRATFIRVNANYVRLDPNGSENFRNQAAGKHLDLDTLGDSVTICCHVAGVWDIIASNGTLAFEA